MISRIKNLLRMPMVSGSMWISAGNVFVSLGNYIFNLMMGRFLTTSEYGAYVSLISLSIIVSLLAGIVTTLATKFAASYSSNQHKHKLSRLAQRLTLISLIVSICLFFMLTTLRGFVSDFLQLEDVKSIVFMNVLVGLGLIASVNRGLLQGLLQFKFLAILGVVGVLLKLLSGFILVQDYRVLGGVLALLISSIVGWFLSFVPLRHLFKSRIREKLGLRKRIVEYSIPSLSYNLALMLFLSVDILLVKHYFNAQTAGIFAASTVMGKVIFYFSAPITSVFFPIISSQHSAGKPYMKNLLFTLLMVGIPGIVGVAFFLLFPTIMVKIFFPRGGYEGSGQFIGWYGLYMLFSSLNIVFTNLFLALEHTKKTSLFLISLILQGAGIVIFHGSIYQVITVLCVVSLMLLIVHSMFFIRAYIYEKK